MRGIRTCLHTDLLLGDNDNRQMQGTALWQRLSESFGYLNKQGYCSGSNTVGQPSGTCHLFPVIIGETGTAFSVRHHCRMMWHVRDTRHGSLWPMLVAMAA